MSVLSWVFIIFMIVSPTKNPAAHIQALSIISKLTSYEHIREDAKKSLTTEEFLEILSKGEKEYL